MFALAATNGEGNFESRRQRGLGGTFQKQASDRLKNLMTPALRFKMGLTLLIRRRSSAGISGFNSAGMGRGCSGLGSIPSFYAAGEREGPLTALLLCQARSLRAMEEHLLAGSLKLFKT